jgi:hypothetical protein
MASFLTRALNLPAAGPTVDLATGWRCSKDGLVCSGSGSSPGSRRIRVSEGWKQALPFEAGEENAFRSSTTRFELRIDGNAVALGAPTESSTGSRVTRQWTTSIVTPTSGSFVVEGRWYWEDDLVRRTTVTVTIS